MTFTTFLIIICLALVGNFAFIAFKWIRFLYKLIQQLQDEVEELRSLVLPLE